MKKNMKNMEMKKALAIASAAFMTATASVPAFAGIPAVGQAIVTEAGDQTDWMWLSGSECYPYLLAEGDTVQAGSRIIQSGEGKTIVYINGTLVKTIGPDSEYATGIGCVVESAEPVNFQDWKICLRIVG